QEDSEENGQEARGQEARQEGRSQEEVRRQEGGLRRRAGLTDEPARVRPQAPLRPDARAVQRQPGPAWAPADLRHPVAPRERAALRLPPRDGRRAQELVGAKGAFIACRRETARGRGGRPPAVVCRLRG